MTRRPLAPLLAALAPLALVACGSGSSSSGSGSGGPADQPAGPVVAHVGPAVITAAEVQAKLGEQSPFLQARYRDLTHKRQFVDNLVRFELLAQEARRRGLDKKPQVADAIDKVLVQELIQEEFDQKQASFTDAQLQDYYQKHIDEFVRPERVRAEQIFLAAPKADRAARAKAKQKLAKVLAQLKQNDLLSNPQNPGHVRFQPRLFEDLAHQLTDDPATKATGGDMRYLSKEDMARIYSQPFADSVFALTQPNELTGIVEDDKGYHLARLTNRQLAVNRTFDDPQVKDTLKGRLFRQERTVAFDKYVEKLKQDAHVTIDDKVLAAVEVPGANLPPPMPALAQKPVVPTAAPAPTKPSLVVKGAMSPKK